MRRGGLVFVALCLGLLAPTPTPAHAAAGVVSVGYIDLSPGYRVSELGASIATTVTITSTETGVFSAGGVTEEATVVCQFNGAGAVNIAVGYFWAQGWCYGRGVFGSPITLECAMDMQFARPYTLTVSSGSCRTTVGTASQVQSLTGMYEMQPDGQIAQSRYRYAGASVLL